MSRGEVFQRWQSKTKDAPTRDETTVRPTVKVWEWLSQLSRATERSANFTCDKKGTTHMKCTVKSRDVCDMPWECYHIASGSDCIKSLIVECISCLALFSCLVVFSSGVFERAILFLKVK